MDRNFETGQSGAVVEAAGFRAPRKFFHTGTDMAGGTTFGAQAYTGLGNGGQAARTNGVIEPQTQPITGKSWHIDTFGYYGVQRRDVARDAQGWRTYEEQR